MAPSPSRFPARLLYFAAACVLAFEEWIWTHAAAVLRRIGQWVPFRWIEGWVRRRTPLQALALYVLPVLVVLPLKGVAVGMMARGHVVLGCAVLFLDKVIGTAVLARLWELTEPAITTFDRIRRGRDAFLRLRSRLYRWLHQQAAYRRARDMLDRMRRKGGVIARFREQLARQRRARARAPLPAEDGQAPRRP